MPDGVADVVRERADSEGQLIGIVCAAKEVDDEVAGAHVVGEIGKEGIAERIVANVLNDTAAVGVGACLVKLRGGKAGIAAEEQGRDRLLPGEIDKLLMGQHGIGACRGLEAGQEAAQ